MMSKKIMGVDISRWNNVLSFKDIKNDGYDFVILRAGGNNGGFYKDPKFETYYKEAKKAKLKVGAYYDTGKDFISAHVGNACAEHFKELLSGKQFEYPVYADIETVATVHRRSATKAFLSFAANMEKSGYFVGCYASDISGFKDRLEKEYIEGRYTIWCARYGNTPSYIKDYAIWQKTNLGVVAGVIGNVDIDESYVDFPKIMKKKGLNGYGN